MIVKMELWIARKTNIRKVRIFEPSNMINVLLLMTDAYERLLAGRQFAYFKSSINNGNLKIGNEVSGAGLGW